MENASKALLMAAGVLVGVLIISIGVYLFSTYAAYSRDTYNKIESTQIDQFNTQFLKYYGQRTTEEGKVLPVLCTAHDIISLANLAKQNNIQWEVANQETYDPNTYYIQIDIGNSRNTSHLEKLDDSEQIKFIKENATHTVETTDEAGNIKEEEQIKYYYCPTYPEISNVTKRVCHMKFIEYNP